MQSRNTSALEGLVPWVGICDLPDACTDAGLIKALDRSSIFSEREKTLMFVRVGMGGPQPPSLGTFLGWLLNGFGRKQCFLGERRHQSLFA